MEISNDLIWNNHMTLIKKLENQYKDLISEYKNKKQDTQDIKEIPQIIWMCWWQGIENAPEIVQICYERLKKIAGNRKINLITAENYKNYIEIPEYILEKLNNNTISITHFSDVLRVNLLSKYGGIWIDATCFLTDNIFEDITEELYTVKLPYNEKETCVSEGKWCIFFIASSKNNILFRFLSDFYNIYWKEENSVIAYYLTDYMITIAYRNINAVKEMIDKVPENNALIHTLKEKLNYEFNEEEYKNIINENKIHKLAHEKEYIKIFSNGEETFYGYISKLK